MSATFLDYDNDGLLDIYTGNMWSAPGLRVTSAPTFMPDATPEVRALYRRHVRGNSLLRNLGNGRFEEVSASAGAAFLLSEVGRGAAFGDIDNDGDTDIVISNNNGAVRLLINNVGNRKHWLGLQLVPGARVAIVRKTGPTLWRRARVDGSYASANDPRVLVGLGDSTEAPTVRVTWPDGRTEEWPNVAIDRYTTLTERRAP